MKKFCAFNTNSLPLPGAGQRLNDLIGRLFCVAMVIILSSPGNLWAVCTNPNNPDSASCTVQYRVAMAFRTKCGIEEFIQDDPPIIHLYHHRQTHALYDYTIHEWGTVGETSGSAGNVVWSAQPGTYSNQTHKTADITADDFQLGKSCDPSNHYSTTITVKVDNTDNRYHTQNGDGANPCSSFWWSNYVEHTQETIGGATWRLYNNQWGWYCDDVKTGYNSYDLYFDCYGLHVGDTTSEAFSSDGYPPYPNLFSGVLHAPPTRTETDWDDSSAQNVTTGDAADGFSQTIESGSSTQTLDEEYTDDELRGYILADILPFAGDWGSGGGDFWQTVAYSAIDPTHRSGAPYSLFTDVSRDAAELQAMQYRFDVPSSLAGTEYQISWDEVTFDTSTGSYSAAHKETQIFGNGSDAYTDPFGVAPPAWAAAVGGGFQFTFVANVQIIALARLYGSSVSAVPATGPGWGSGGGSGCSSCGGSGSFGGLNSISAGVYASFSLGQANAFNTAGKLQIWSAQPSAAMATPAALSLTAANPAVVAVQMNNQLRQVSAPQVFTDIVVRDPYSYLIKYYSPSQVGAMVNGVYQLSGTPYITWLVVNPDGASATNRLQLIETNGTQVSVYECDYSNTTGSWKYEYPGGLREDEVDTSSVTNSLGIITTVTTMTRVPGGPNQFKEQRMYQLYYPGFGYYPQGPYLVQDTLDPDNNPRTTTYTYNWGSYANGTSIPLQMITYPDGYWLSYQGYYSAGYDSQGRVVSTMTPFCNTPQSAWPSGFVQTEYSYDPSLVSGSGDDGSINPNTPRSEWVYGINGAMRGGYTAFPSAGKRLDIRCPSSDSQWNDPDNLVTTTMYYTTGPNASRVQSVLNPDGTMQIYTYAQAADGSQTNTVYSGQPNAGHTAIVDGTESITILGPFGQTVSATQIDIASGIITSKEVYGNYDQFSRPQTVVHLDGTSNTTAYACCGVSFTIDRDGVMTSYQYDASKRQVATTRLGITTTNVLDSLGHVLKSMRIGTDSSVFILSQSGYDLSGQLMAETNALGGVTRYSQTINSSGGLIRTTVNPDGGTRIEQYNLDRTLTNVTGTAVQGVRYQYGYDNYFDGFNPPYTQEIKLNNDGTDSSEWTQSDVDILGRPFKTIYASPSGSSNPTSYSYYNSIGQLTNSVDPDGVSTIYAYNAKGEQIFTAIDVDQDGAIDFNGVDRITWTTNDVVIDHGTYVSRSQTFVWDTLNSNTPKLTSVSESSVDGLNTWETSYRDGSVAVTNHSQTVYGAVGSRTETSTAPDGSQSVSVFSNGLLISVTQKDSTGAQIGQTTYAYDAHGRQHSVADARDGATVYGYNNADLATTVTTPNPATGIAPETTTTYYDTSLRATNVVQPDGTSITNIYYPGGQLWETFGSRTYPVAYTYDYAGRMKTMTTWRNFPSSGNAVTTWNYDPYQGFLSDKVYADGQGPIYTYTPAGRLATRTWARLVSGQPLTTSYAYDTAGSLTNVTYSDGTTPGVGTVYNRLGRPASVTQGTIVTTQNYNLAGELLVESYSGGPLNGLAISNTYDADLRRTVLNTRSGSANLLTTTYGYDYASRLQSVNDGNNNVATYSYLANSPLVGQISYQQSGATRMTTTKQYDFLNRLTQISSAPSGAGLLPYTYAYNYNAANQRTRNTFSDGSHWSYQYDWLGQVTNGGRYWSDGTPVAGQQYQYLFDTIGNRTKTWTGGDTNGANLRPAIYSVNNLNQITQRDVPGTNDVTGAALVGTNVTVNGVAADRKAEYFHGLVGTNNASQPFWLTSTIIGANTTLAGRLYVAKEPEQFQYDADGNLTGDGRWSYTWDGENRLIGMTVNTSAGPLYQLTFAYDWQGRRIQKIMATNGLAYSTNNFLYDGWNLAAELKPNNSLVRSYVWGTDLSGSQQGAGGVGGLLETRYYGTATTNTFAAFDGNGNVSALINAGDGTVVANYEYGPFGEVIRNSGPIAKNNPLRFSTKYQDDESDLLYYGYRYYNQSSGRWLNRDPRSESGGINVTSFSRNDSINEIDLFGLAYQISNLSPTGWWLLSIAEVNFGSTSMAGFHSRYLPTDGNFGHPNNPCEAAQGEIFLAQVVSDPVFWKPVFDSTIVSTTPNDPIPPYNGFTEPLTIIDAPHLLQATSLWDSKWSFEDCAVCRTHSDPNTTVDKVLGCIRFDFIRHSDNSVSIVVINKGGKSTGHSVYAEEAQAPTKLWKKGLKNWFDQVHP